MFYNRLSVMILVGALMMFCLPDAVEAESIYADGVEFNADGPINGWYWLRSLDPHWFQWTFYLEPEELARLSCYDGNAFDPNFHLVMVALVTNGVNGGMGHEKRLDLEIFTGGLQYVEDVVLQNPSCSRTLEDSFGEGYLAIAEFELTNEACSELIDTSELVVEYVWADTDNWMDCCCITDHHVAFNDKTSEGLGTRLDTVAASLKIVVE